MFSVHNKAAQRTYRKVKNDTYFVPAPINLPCLRKCRDSLFSSPVKTRTSTRMSCSCSRGNVSTMRLYKNICYHQCCGSGKNGSGQPRIRNEFKVNLLLKTDQNLTISQQNAQLNNFNFFYHKKFP